MKLHIPVGTTDSEHAFCWILDQIHFRFSDQEPAAEVLFQFIAQLSVKINSLGVFNVNITNGEYLFAYCANNLHWITRRSPFGRASLIDAEVVINFSEETTESDVVTVIATQPLTDDETWQKMTKGQWHLFRLGESIASGQALLSMNN